MTGVVVNAKLSTSRRTRRRVRAILHNASKTSLPAQNRSRRPNFPAHLRGLIDFISMINPRQASALYERLRSLKS